MNVAKNIRKMQREFETKLYDLFPTVPPSDIRSYIHLHPSLSIVDFLVHFLQISEPASNNIDIQMAMNLAKARQVLRQQTKKETEAENTQEPQTSRSTHERGEVLEKLVLFGVENSNFEFQNRIFNAITRLRRDKKRVKFLDDDFLSKIASYYANELMLGNISIDSDEWKKLCSAHPDTLSDTFFYANFILGVADPTDSLIQLIAKEPDCHQIIVTSAKYCAIGIAVSKLGTVFFCIIITNINVV